MQKGIGFLKRSVKIQLSCQRVLTRLTLSTIVSLFLLLIVTLFGISSRTGGFSVFAFGLPKFLRHSNQEATGNQTQTKEKEHQTNLAPDPESNIPLLGPKAPEPTVEFGSESTKLTEPQSEKTNETPQPSTPLILKPLTSEIIERPILEKLNEHSEPSKTLPSSSDATKFTSTPQVILSVPVEKKPNLKSLNSESGLVLTSNAEKVTIHIAPLSQEAILIPLNPGWKMTFQGKRENHYLQEFSKCINGSYNEKNSETERVSLQALTGLQSKLTAAQWTQAYLLQLARNLTNPKNLQANVIRNNPNDALFFWSVKNDKKVEMQSELQRVLLGKEAIYLIRYTRKTMALTPIEKEQWQAYLQVPFLMTMRVLNEKKYSVDSVERYSVYLSKSQKQHTLKSTLTKQVIEKNKTDVKKIESKQSSKMLDTHKTDEKKTESKRTDLTKTSKDRYVTNKSSERNLPAKKVPAPSSSPAHSKSIP